MTIVSPRAETTCVLSLNWIESATSSVESRWTAARALSGFVGMLRRQRFDLVIDFHAILKSGLLALVSGAPRRASYAWPFARESAWLFANARARIAPRRISRFERNRGLVEFVAKGASASPKPWPSRMRQE